MGASIAAHDEARRLDPTVPTSVEYTLLMLGDRERIEQAAYAGDLGAHGYLMMYAGRVDEVKKGIASMRLDDKPQGYRDMLEAVKVIDTAPDEAIRLMDSAMAIGAKMDPEAVFLMGLTCALLNVEDRAVKSVADCVVAGYTPVYAMLNAPVLAKIRDRADFQSAVEQARQRQRIALAIFERGGGLSLLGITPQQAL